MSLIEHLFSTNPTQIDGLPEHLKAIITDVKNVKLSAVLSSKNTYSGSQLHQLINVCFRALLFWSKTSLDLKLEEKLKTFVRSLLGLQLNERSLKPADLLAILLYLAHGLFMKENWVGPSYLSPNARKIEKQGLKIDTSKKYQIELQGDATAVKLMADNELSVEDLSAHSLDKVKKESYLKLSEIDTEKTKLLAHRIGINGEDFIKSYRLMDLFAVFKALLRVALETEEIVAHFGVYISLLNARAAKLHSGLMEQPCEILRKELELFYAQTIEKLKTELEAESEQSKQKLIELSFIKIEFALSLLQFYEFRESQLLIMQVMSNLGIEVSFTGKMGIRTKYQNFKVAQLVVDVRQQPAEQTPVASDTPQPTVVPLDEIFDNILHEKPVIDDFIGYSNSEQSLETNVVLLALMIHTLKSQAFDDQQREKAMAYLNNIVHNFRDYAVMTTALVFRSNLEFQMTRKMERSMLQFEQLSRDWHSKDFALVDRLRLAHTINFPSYIELITTLAQNYIRIQAFMSAFGLYKDLGLHNRAVECLFLGGQKGQALDYLNGLSESFQKQPSILCILGDIYKDPSYYQRAIESSNGKFAAAFRALGNYHFVNKDYDLSLGFYQQAVELNDYSLSSWMRIAFIKMEKGDVEDAISAYKKAVWINESEAGAWTNLAILYRRVSKGELAFEAIQKAIGLKERNWYNWYNAVIISLENQNFSWFVRSCLKLAELDRPEEIKDFIVRKFPLVLQHSIKSAGENVSQLRQSELLLSK